MTLIKIYNIFRDIPFENNGIILAVKLISGKNISSGDFLVINKSLNLLISHVEINDLYNDANIFINEFPKDNEDLKYNKLLGNEFFIKKSKSPDSADL